MVIAFPALAQRGRILERAPVSSAPAEDEGTRLTVQTNTPSVSCAVNGSGADVSLLYTVVSTGSADSANLVMIVNGAESSLGTIASGNVNEGGGWTFAGRTKLAEGAAGGFYGNGSYTFQVCATQSGAHGREVKRACSEPVTVTVDCIVPSSCPVSEFYGEIVSNPQMCNGNGPAKIQVQFRGDFGSSATLDISGPNGYQHSVVVSRSGDSCNYHYNWDLGRDPSGGVYTLSVNGDDLVYGVTLSCQ